MESTKQICWMLKIEEEQRFASLINRCWGLYLIETAVVLLHLLQQQTIHSVLEIKLP